MDNMAFIVVTGENHATHCLIDDPFNSVQRFASGEGIRGHALFPIECGMASCLPSLKSRMSERKRTIL